MSGDVVKVSVNKRSGSYVTIRHGDYMPVIAICRKHWRTWLPIKFIFVPFQKLLTFIFIVDL